MTEYRRPQYENEYTLNQETDVTDLINKKLGYTVEKLNKYAYRLDHVVLENRNDMIAFLEIKGRYYNSTVYPKEMISLHKWIYGLELSKAVGIPYWIASRFKDKILWVCANDCTGTMFTYNGRRDRGDPYDIEPCVYIPMYEFAETDEFFKRFKENVNGL